MYLLANEKTTIVQSTNKDPSLIVTTNRPEWSEVTAHFLPTPSSASPHFTHQTTGSGSGSSSVSRSHSLYTHLTSPDSDSSIQDINNQCLGRMKQKDG